jgi:DNA-directed RNA polymerase alpha subunit
VTSSGSTPIEDLGLSAPAVRALKGAGYTHLEQLANVRVSELEPLHGFGPKSVRQLREALAAHGLSFAE